MNKKTILSLLLILFLMFITSCTSESFIKDDYTMEVSIDAQNEVINNIGKSIPNTRIVYLKESTFIRQIVVYDFTLSTISKTIYSFYTNLETFRYDLKHNNLMIDGDFVEVDETILLITTKFNSVDTISYQELLNRLDAIEEYNIIK